MLLSNQINSFANFAFNLLICIVLLYFFYLFIHISILFSKIQSVVFSCTLKKKQEDHDGPISLIALHTALHTYC